MDTASTFQCGDEKLVGILSAPAAPGSVGALILVGGPQYRIGSHRQFLLLARHLADSGIAVLRFDFRGMGDSTGAPAKFDETVPDITAAIDALKRMCPAVRRVVLWGLCDGASAALLYWRATRDPRIAGMVLLNPWIRSEQSLASTHVKHYYSKRVFERQFWAKLARGGIDVRGAVQGFLSALHTATRGSEGSATGREASFQDRMATALAGFAGPVLIILSGQDYTAKEFIEYAESSPRWNGLIGRKNVYRVDLPKADHTFSTAAWRHEVERLTADWLARVFPADVK